MFSLEARALADWRCAAEMANQRALEDLFKDPSWNAWKFRQVRRTVPKRFAGPESSEFFQALIAFPEVTAQTVTALIPFFWTSTFGEQSKNFTGRWAVQPSSRDPRDWNRLSVTLVNKPDKRDVKLTLSLLRDWPIDQNFYIYAAVVNLAEESGIDTLKWSSQLRDGWNEYSLNIDELPFSAATFEFIGKLQEKFAESRGEFLFAFPRIESGTF